MDVKAFSTTQNTSNLIMRDSNAVNSAYTQTTNKVNAENNTEKISNISDVSNKDDSEQKKTQKELNNKEIERYTEALNEFFKLSKADLKLSLHEKTKRFMVQLVDTSNNKVLREFPPKELLDTVAKISDYIGGLLDKKI